MSSILGVDETVLSGQATLGTEQRLSMVVRLLMQTVEAVSKLFTSKGQLAALLEQMSKWCPRGGCSNCLLYSRECRLASNQVQGCIIQ